MTGGFLLVSGSFSEMIDMPYPNEHAARIRDPSEFEDKSFRRKKITDGIDAIMGKLKGQDTMTIQAYRFDKDKYTVKTAKAWLKKHDVKAIEFEAASDTKNEGDDMADEKNEIYASVPNSYEDKMKKIRDALRKSTLFGAVENEWSLSIEATFADSIIVDKSTKEGVKYYKADWAINADGDVVISNVKDVEVEAVVKIKNENEELKDESADTRRTLLNEDIQTSIFLEEVTTPTGKKQYKGKVKIAQKADELNRNRRIYPANVLQEAVERLKEKLKKGPIPMYKGHRTENGKNINDLNEIVALIHDVNYHPEAKTVSLDDITFVETQAGKDLIALAEAGLPLQTSQNANGKSHLIKYHDGKSAEKVDFLDIEGWDALRAGKASVSQADMEFQVLTEETEMPDERILTEEEVEAKIKAREDAIRAELLNEMQKMKPEEKKDEKLTETQKPETDKSAEALNEMTKRLDEMTEFIETGKRKEAIEAMVKAGEGVINESLKDEKYKIFNEADKKHISSIALKDVPELYEKVDVSKPDEFKGKIDAILNEKVEEVSHFIAQARLEAKGYGNPPGNGIQHIEIINENYADAELTGKLTNVLNERLIERDGNRPFYTDADSRVLKFMKEVEAKHIQDIQKSIQMGSLLNEATLIGTDVGPKIASVGISLIRNVFPRLSALQVCALGTMDKIQDIITVKAFSQAISSNPYTNVLVLTPGEDTALNTVKTTTTPYPIIATQKAVGGVITSLAQAIARGAGNIDPIADTMEDIARYFQTTINHLIWWAIICKAQAYDKTEVTNWTNLTIVPGTASATPEFYSAHEGWIQFEWVKKLDTNGNPVYAMPLALYGTTSADITYQPVVAREHGGDNTALVYGSAQDYTVNWADGTITLTAAGLAKCATDGTPDVKYSYTENAKFWSITTPTGLTGEDHLKNLGLMAGQAKTLVRNRDYEPTFMAMNFDNNDMIANSPVYAAAGNRAGNLLDSRGNMSQWQGLEVAGDRMLPSEWIVVGTQGKAIYKVQTPMSMKRLGVAGKTNDEIQVEQYDCEDCPEPQAFSLLGITDINT